MADWVVSDIVKDEDSISSLAPNRPDLGADVTSSQNPRVETNYVERFKNLADVVEVKPIDGKDNPITQLGNTHQVKSFSVGNKKKTLPSWVIATIIMAPILIIFIISAFSNKQAKKSDDSFLFKTLESDYFTMSISPDYSIDSVIDKKVPFLEKHNLKNTKSGEKNLNIIIKDVKFDYELKNNALFKVRDISPDLYSKEEYKLKYKEGYYFKKKSENFEDLVLIVDRSKSVMYEITFSSPSYFYNDEAMQKEFDDILQSFTFL